MNSQFYFPKRKTGSIIINPKGNHLPKKKGILILRKMTLIQRSEALILFNLIGWK